MPPPRPSIDNTKKSLNKDNIKSKTSKVYDALGHRCIVYFYEAAKEIFYFHPPAKNNEKLQTHHYIISPFHQRFVLEQCTPNRKKNEGEFLSESTRV